MTETLTSLAGKLQTALDMGQTEYAALCLDRLTAVARAQMALGNKPAPDGDTSAVDEAARGIGEML